MMHVGIEAMNAYLGSACLNVDKLARHRNLDMTRFTNLLMKERTVALPYEDPITFGLNAAKPLVDAMSPEEKDRIEMVITCTESAHGTTRADIRELGAGSFWAYDQTVPR